MSLSRNFVVDELLKKKILSFIYHCFSTDPDFADISRDGQMFVQDSSDIKFYLSHGDTRARQLEDW